ncbi:hypothetical protein CBF34_05945 [Vagococcus penaei]|uniref:Uncharacterized protein n=1 Tax=Vagococcus penaei TaxID=633807 RepID=A0A1Q2D3I3_9ENTE|nr:ABC transporter ATP-binding protein [Vagococcus penaei]AQP52930.1 hypothetical protein BW732_00945 [Vagococcus penaei]RSU02613.1 hypothetical protein CBF34_05945 [Vagococcus penaei]
MIELNKVNVSYGKKKILQDISMTFVSGEVVGLVAPNGTGKSTLLNALMNHVAVQSGTITFDQHLTYKNEKTRMKIYRMISIMPDQNDLYAHLTGWEHLKMYKGIWKAKKINLKQLVARLGMSHYVGQKVKTYSLGMKQRLCFAMQIACDTQIMLMDEVMNGLDPNNVELISEVIDEKRQEGKTILIASHLLENLHQYADRIFFIENGQLELFTADQQEDNAIYLKLSKVDYELLVEKVGVEMFPIEIDHAVLVDVSQKEYRQLLINHLDDLDIMSYSVQPMDLTDTYKLKYLK